MSQEPGEIPQHVEKPKRPSIISKLHSLKDKLRYGEDLPLQWNEWKKVVINGAQNVIPEELAPKRFYVSGELLRTFQEMLPIQFFGISEDDSQREAANKAKSGLEVGRILVADPPNNRLLVQTQNNGDSQLIEGGRELRLRRKAGEIGILHTHPKNGMPSSTDIATFLAGRHTAGFIITPIRVISFFRTDQTPNLSFPIIEGYLNAMAKSKKRSINQAGWSLTYEDLNELHILGYQSDKGSKLFVRKDNKK